MIYDAIVLGAGISGLIIGRRLKDLGQNVLIIDKGRSVGGRMATRRGDGTLYDHGVQFLTTNTVLGLPEEYLSSWELVDGKKSYVSPFGMNKLAKVISEGLEVRLNSKVEKIKEDIIFLEDGESFRARKIFINFPLPQIIDVLKNSEMNIPEEFKQVTYAMALVSLLTIQSDEAVLKDLKFLKPSKGMIFSIANQNSKGMTDKLSLVIVMNNDFSVLNFSKSDQESLDLIQQHLNECFIEEFGFLPNYILESCELKKWKYSHPLNPLGVDFYDLRGDNKVILTGDGFSGASVARVITSAMAMSVSILKS